MCRSAAILSDVPRECWAKQLGGCAGGISGEHLISKCVLAPETTLSGLWSEQPITLRRESITANILCREHNWKLSALDSEAGQTIQKLEEISSLFQVREKTIASEPREAFHPNGKRKKLWRVGKKRVHRPDFERWLAKTVINMCAAKRVPIVPGQSSLVPKGIVEFVFGGAKVDGLKFAIAAAEGQPVDIARRYSISMIAHTPTGTITGGVITFASLVFLVQLQPEGMPLSLVQEIAGADVQPLPMRKITWTLARRKSHELRFAPSQPMPDSW